MAFRLFRARALLMHVRDVRAAEWILLDAVGVTFGLHGARADVLLASLVLSMSNRDARNPAT